MKLQAYFVLAWTVLIGSYNAMVYSGQGAVLTCLANDAQAFAYCEQNKNTYVVIVWPKGYSHLSYITTTLNRYGSVKYVKNMILNKSQMFSLYRKLHTSMSYASAKKYFKPYTSAFHYEPLHVVALVFHTDAPLEKIISLKKKMRTHIGKSYYSLHINDYYDPGTLESARAVFKRRLS